MPAHVRKRAADNDDGCHQTDDTGFVVSFSKSETQSTSRPRKKLKGDGIMDLGEDRHMQTTIFQKSPYEPTGAFSTHKRLDASYKIDRKGDWDDMTSYRTLNVDGRRYDLGDYVYVANERSVTQHTKRGAGSYDSDDEEDGSSETIIPGEGDWIGKLLEVRAVDSNHVYARLMWMYWPDELPGTFMAGRKLASGRQPWHGRRELLASNHMDIISVHAINGKPTVEQWHERDDDAELDGDLYWRQAFDARTNELSTILQYCSCRQPYNPDKVAIQCRNPQCQAWLHEHCLKHAQLTRAYERSLLDDLDGHASMIDEVKLGFGAAGHLTPRTLGDISLASSGQEQKFLPATFNRSQAPSSNRSRTRTQPYDGIFTAELVVRPGRVPMMKVTDLRLVSEAGEDEAAMAIGGALRLEGVKCLVCEQMLE